MPPDALLTWLQADGDPRWHLADGDDMTACLLVLPNATPTTTDHLPEHPAFCRSCRSAALQRLDEVT